MAVQLGRPSRPANLKAFAPRVQVALPAFVNRQLIMRMLCAKGPGLGLGLGSLGHRSMAESRLWGLPSGCYVGPRTCGGRVGISSMKAQEPEIRVLDDPNAKRQSDYR